MSITSTLTNAFSFERQRARYESEPLENEDQAPERLDTAEPVTDPVVEGPARTTEENAASRGDEEEGQVPRDDGSSDSGNEVEADTARSGTTGAATDVTAEQRAEFPARTTVTLAELEEERELARRRSSICVLLAVFVLFRLWVEAIQEADFGLLLLCLVGTSWTARWIRHNREREEDLDRRIANYLENSESGGGSGNAEVDRNELRMLSFQAQLALAIMESQRQMMQGGFGNPDGTEESPGVSEEARSQWQRFSYKASEASDKSPAASSRGEYGSVAQQEGKGSGLDEAPHCSICLSEYEDGDSVVQLPCKHLYHDECISSWTSNHVKCPLCNFDLESVATDSASSSSTPRQDSIV